MRFPTGVTLRDRILLFLFALFFLVVGACRTEDSMNHLATMVTIIGVPLAIIVSIAIAIAPWIKKN